MKDSRALGLKRVRGKIGKKDHEREFEKLENKPFAIQLHHLINMWFLATGDWLDDCFCSLFPFSAVKSGNCKYSLIQLLFQLGMATWHNCSQWDGSSRHWERTLENFLNGADNSSSIFSDFPPFLLYSRWQRAQCLKGWQTHRKH